MCLHHIWHLRGIENDRYLLARANFYLSTSLDLRKFGLFRSLVSRLLILVVRVGGLKCWYSSMKRIQLQHPHISPAGSSYEILLRFSHFSQRDSGFHQASTDWLIRLDSLYKWLAAIGESRKYTDFMNVTWLLSVLHKFIIESLTDNTLILILRPPDIFKYGQQIMTPSDLFLGMPG